MDLRMRDHLTFMGKSAREQERFIQEQRFIQYWNNRQLRAAVIKRDGRRCACCGITYDLVLDHILPVSKGGRTALHNLQLLCRVCDRNKDDAVIDYRRK